MTVCTKSFAPSRIISLCRSMLELQVLADDRQLDERAAVVVVGRETDGVATSVKARHAIERLHEIFAGQLGTSAAQRLGDDLGADPSFDGSEREILAACVQIGRAH